MHEDEDGAAVKEMASLGEQEAEIVFAYSCEGKAS